jgi:hypothetical protein
MSIRELSFGEWILRSGYTELLYGLECAFPGCAVSCIQTAFLMRRKKKKTKRFQAVTAVKELARERVGAPPAERIVIEKKKKPEKHKPTLGKLLDQGESE